MKIARLTYPPLNVLHLSSPRPRLRHGRQLALLSRPNLYTPSFALLLALLPHLPPLPTSSSVPTPGSRLRFSPITCDPTFLSLNQTPPRSRVRGYLSTSKPRTLRSLKGPFAPPSLSLNFLRLPETFSHLLPLAQTKLPIPC